MFQSEMEMCTFVKNDPMDSFNVTIDALVKNDEIPNFNQVEKISEIKVSGLLLWMQNTKKMMVFLTMRTTFIL